MSLSISYSMISSESDIKQRCKFAILRKASDVMYVDPAENPDQYASNLTIFRAVFYNESKLEVAAKMLIMKCIEHCSTEEISDADIESSLLTVFPKIIYLA